MTLEHPPVRASRFLEQTLLWNILIHFAAIVTMAIFLMPGIPGGTSPDNATRIQYVADHPWLWRVGWLPWHLCAAIDLITGVALVSTRWIPRGPAFLTLAVTLAAVAFEQTGEIPWTLFGPAHASQAIAANDPASYLAFEAWAFHKTAVLGASLYMAMALGWTWCFAAAGTWTRFLTWLSIPTWTILGIGSVGLLLPEPFRPGEMLVGITNGVGFALLQVWLWLVSEEVLRRSRPAALHGRMAPWKHPAAGPFAALCNGIANSLTLRAFCEWLPPVAFRSDITDVIYVNYLVETERLNPYLPEGFELQRFGHGGRFSLFTFLTYKHGHFGPAFFGPLRRLMPSPVHSNWRIYVRDCRTQTPGIYFVTNAIDSTPHALAARLLAEGMPMHIPAEAKVLCHADGTITLRLASGNSTAPDVNAVLRPSTPDLPGSPWTDCFANYGEFLEICVPQDRAFSAQPWYDRVTRQEIQLGIPLAICEPLAGSVESIAAKTIVGDAPSVCFRVPTVSFRFDRELYDSAI